MNITKHKNKAFFAPQPLSFVKTVKEALIPRSVLYKLQNFTIHCKALQNIWDDRQGSFGSMPEPKGDKKPSEDASVLTFHLMLWL